MSRRPARALQCDIARAIRAIEQTGARMMVEIATDGTIRLLPVDHSDPHPKPERDIGGLREIVL